MSWHGVADLALQVAPLPPGPATPLEIAMNPIDFIGRIIYKKIGGVNRSGLSQIVACELWL